MRHVIPGKEASTAVEKRPAASRARRLVPDTDIYETKDETVLLVDLPGVDQEELDVRVEERVLTIVGRSSPTDPGERRQLAGDNALREYRRAFQLPETVDADEIHATLKKGVLTVRLPKAEAARARKIEVKHG